MAYSTNYDSQESVEGMMSVENERLFNDAFSRPLWR